MKIFRLLIFCMLATCLVTSCDDNDSPLYFVGDSIIARWDIAESFPSRVVYNDGKSGAGLTYIESLKGRYANKEVVIMIGTNDNYMLADDKRAEYARQYLEAIQGLDASKVYLYSVLPRGKEAAGDRLNADIRAFNGMMQEMVANMPQIIYINVYDDFMRGSGVNVQLYDDGLHLSAYGYEILTKALLNKL